MTIYILGMSHRRCGMTPSGSPSLVIAKHPRGTRYSSLVTPQLLDQFPIGFRTRRGLPLQLGILLHIDVV